MSEERKGKQTELTIPGRFTVPQRIEHFILAVSFTVLGLTGLVQKFGLNPLSEYLISLMGGIETTRVIHRAAAVVFALLSLYHVIAVGYKIYVRRVGMTMIPVLKDVADGVNWLGYSLFLRKEPPRMPRYTFAEKLEYWALIWGGIIMVATGFMLWNPLITTRFLPGQFIPAAKAAHGGEAVLAVLAIIVWHFYNVHIKMFNRSMFTGKLTLHQMEEEHGEEWREVFACKQSPPQSPAAMRRRRSIFIPAAFIVAAGGIGGIYWTATAETTAISTVPVPMTRTGIYSPMVAQPQEPEEAAGIAAPLIPHPVAGQEECGGCHGKSGFLPVPADHQGRPVQSCRICHNPGPSSGWKIAAGGEAGRNKSGLQPPPHPTTGPYENCLVCHGIGKMKPFPDYHANTKVENCTICHK
jgi:cytochrome b subunit of formate dehydrogenase